MTEKRPKLKIPREKFLKIRVTPEEKEVLKMLAMDRGMSVSKFIALAIQEYKLDKR